MINIFHQISQKIISLHLLGFTDAANLFEKLGSLSILTQDVIKKKRFKAVSTYRMTLTYLLFLLFFLREHIYERYRTKG